MKLFAGDTQAPAPLDSATGNQGVSLLQQVCCPSWHCECEHACVAQLCLIRVGGNTSTGAGFENTCHAPIYIFGLNRLSASLLWLKAYVVCP